MQTKQYSYCIIPSCFLARAEAASVACSLRLLVLSATLGKIKLLKGENVHEKK
jgi:hypothetical protein